MPSKPGSESSQWFERIAGQHIAIQSLTDKNYDQRGVTLDILRADLLHPVCSGNKFFKLKYYLLEAMEKGYRRIGTFGGAWSNHIAATAYAARACNIASTGYIRGEEPVHWSATLLSAREEGMDIRFLPRAEFREKAAGSEKAEGMYLIPQGGYGVPGVRGAAEMLDHAPGGKYTHICCACGTGTMLAGLVSAANENQMVTGISVLRHGGLEKDVLALLEGFSLKAKFRILPDFTFGGYARKTDALIQFMNDFFHMHQVPTDWVYTGKLMYATDQLIREGYFPPGSRILAIHSGGLQGNNSLKKGELNY